ncbi:YjbH domain-containing protein [Thiohalomonas denitrificans]|uniref:YjbH domain-containing protein n=1 Tax=Thiohalomonas denitrificans TaxID=415747 RepID=UPI0026EC31A8|nr:YjbH domain-containing protein [Thiohalomonas denitrificans]
MIRFLATAALIALSPLLWAAPSSTGQTGLINMPDGLIEEDGMWRMGVSRSDPYTAFWTSVSLFPRLEVTARYTEISGAPSGIGDDYGDYKDKAFDAKLHLLKESHLLPALSVGTQDYLGTQLFPANFIAASKRLGDLDATIGYGEDRIDGVYGGLRYHLTDNWRLVAEYDANDYQNDFRGERSGAADRKGGWQYGVEYQWGWLGAQVSEQDDEIGFNLHFDIPLGRSTFIPNMHEPAPFTGEPVTASIEEWQADPVYPRDLVRTLEARGFKKVKVRIDRGSRTLQAELTHSRITLVGRAVGRAARVLLVRGPADTRTLQILYTEREQPLLTYTFTDADALRSYFAGELSHSALEPTMSVRFADPEDRQRFAAKDIRIEPNETPNDIEFGYSEADATLVLEQESRNLSRWQIKPFNLGTYLNDPSGAFHYDIFALGTFTHDFGGGLFFDAGARVTLIEDVSDVTQESNSELPHVRTDVAEYKRGAEAKLNHALLSQYAHPAQRVYTRVSAGIYEEMYGGFGGQALYLPEVGNWAADLSVDWLKQRDFEGTGFRDYSTVTALATLHYRIPSHGLTISTTGGRFLAKDDGVRILLKRRFASGFELGAWYTVTDGDDITSPGSPDEPYHDKGIFVSIPISSLLTKDTRNRGTIALRPWTRDVGQTVASPGDLHGLVEQRLLLNTDQYTGFSGLRE